MKRITIFVFVITFLFIITGCKKSRTHQTSAPNTSRKLIIQNFPKHSKLKPIPYAPPLERKLELPSRPIQQPLKVTPKLVSPQPIKVVPKSLILHPPLTTLPTEDKKPD